MQLEQGILYVSPLCALFDADLMIVQCWPCLLQFGKNVFIQPISQVDLGYPRYKPNFRVCIALHPTLVPPKKSSTHFYVNNRDPLCTKKVPLPSQQETAARPSQPALTYPSWCCLHFYAGELTIFFPRLGKNHYHHIWAILHKKRSDNPSLLLLLVVVCIPPLFIILYPDERRKKLLFLRQNGD